MERAIISEGMHEIAMVKKYVGIYLDMPDHVNIVLTMLQCFCGSIAP